jgi:hypothetical protein
MRVAEYGLRKLAKQLKVTLRQDGKIQPIEYADWNKVITAIKNKIAEIRRLPSGPKREKALQFYSDAADRCEYMKDIWRNELAHTRRLYNKAETSAVITRVRLFIELFKISENNAQEELNRRLQRIQQLRSTDEAPHTSATQRDQGQTGRGESREKAEEI